MKFHIVSLDPIPQILARGRRRPCRSSQSQANPAHGASKSSRKSRNNFRGLPRRPARGRPPRCGRSSKALSHRQPVPQERSRIQDTPPRFGPSSGAGSCRGTHAGIQDNTRSVCQPSLYQQPTSAAGAGRLAISATPDTAMANNMPERFIAFSFSNALLCGRRPNLSSAVTVTLLTYCTLGGRQDLGCWRMFHGLIPCSTGLISSHDAKVMTGDLLECSPSRARQGFASGRLRRLKIKGEAAVTTRPSDAAAEPETSEIIPAS